MEQNTSLPVISKKDLSQMTRSELLVELKRTESQISNSEVVAYEKDYRIKKEQKIYVHLQALREKQETEKVNSEVVYNEKKEEARSQYAKMCSYIQLQKDRLKRFFDF